MRFDDLPEHFEAFLDRAQDVLRLEVEKGRRARDAANAEVTAAQGKLAEISAQQKIAQTKLDGVLADLGRASNLAGLNGEITQARRTLDEASKTLEGLKADIAKTSAELAGLVKKRTDEQQQRDADLAETMRLRAERAEHTTEINKIRALLHSFGRAA
jgi:chromosome segregation ATPase